MITMKVYKTNKTMCESSDKHATTYLNYVVGQLWAWQGKTMTTKKIAES